MSAVQTVLIQPAHRSSAAAPASTIDSRICELVHELRQPLSSIEAIAYYLEMTMPAEQQQARHYMSRLQQLVDESNSILQRAVNDLRRT